MTVNEISKRINNNSTTNSNIPLQVGLSLPLVNSRYKGQDSPTHCGVTCNSLPGCLKNVKLLPEFKVSIQTGSF